MQSYTNCHYKKQGKKFKRLVTAMTVFKEFQRFETKENSPMKENGSPKHVAHKKKTQMHCDVFFKKIA